MDADRERLTALLVAELGRAPVEALIDQTGVDWAGLHGQVSELKKALEAELKTVAPDTAREAELRHLLGLPPRPHGPGEELKKLTDSLGLKEWEGCSCSAIQADMNRVGAAGCRKGRAKFIDRIKANVAAGVAAGKISKWAWVKAAYRAVRMGLALKIDPRDPIPDLFDLAVNNAEKKAKQKASPGEIE
jgi:hypothetical protein